MADPIPSDARKKPPSDQIRKTTIGEYLHAHSAPNGGWRSFLHSNLFAALIIWMLGQAGVVVWFLFNVSDVVEWKSKAEQKMDADHAEITKIIYTLQQYTKEQGTLEEKVNAMQEETKHFDVMEAEHLRLTKDVEELKKPKK